MKAKFYTLGANQELVLENGQVHKPKERESYESFIKRISEENLEELEIKTINSKTIKSLSTVAAKKQLEKSKGVHRKLLRFLLEARGIDTPQEQKAEKPKKKQSNKPVNSERAKAIEEFKKTDEYKSAEKNIGKVVQYETRSQKGKQTGVIKSLTMSKDLKRVYYIINNDKTSKRDCCATSKVNFNL